MNVGKWGNSLAVRLPKELVEALGLKEGDELKLTPKGRRHAEVERDMSREEALAKLRKFRGLIPADFKFDREEAHERG
jgi:antitoxin MazE